MDIGNSRNMHLWDFLIPSNGGLSPSVPSDKQYNRQSDDTQYGKEDIGKYLLFLLAFCLSVGTCPMAMVSSLTTMTVMMVLWLS